VDLGCRFRIQCVLAAQRVVRSNPLIPAHGAVWAVRAVEVAAMANPQTPARVVGRAATAAAVLVGLMMRC
jgi:hypothetical protein